MFLFHQWLELPINTRHEIAARFGIKKRGSTEVVDNAIKSDGYLVKEIEDSLNVKAIQEYVGTKEADMSLLWTWMVEKAEGREMTVPNIDTTSKNEPYPHFGSFDESFNPIPTSGSRDKATFKVEPKRGRSPKKK